jgi:hypothetical protein
MGNCKNEKGRDLSKAIIGRTVLLSIAGIEQKLLFTASEDGNFGPSVDWKLVNLRHYPCEHCALNLISETAHATTTGVTPESLRIEDDSHANETRLEETFLINKGA